MIQQIDNPNDADAAFNELRKIFLEFANDHEIDPQGKIFNICFESINSFKEKMRVLSFYNNANDATFTYVLLRMHKENKLKIYLSAIFSPEEGEKLKEKFSYMLRSSQYQKLEQLAREPFVKSKNSIFFFFFFFF